MKSERFRLHARDFLGTPDGKKHFNEKHFAESAPRYDIATRGLSLFQDRSWKRQLIAALPDLEDPTCVDVACGTGDVTFMLADRYGEGAFIGVDLTAEMIEIARQRNLCSKTRFICGDMCNLPMHDATVDLITGSYAIRNAPDLRDALMEYRRVLKPGGTLAILDFCKPDSRVLQRIQFQLLRFWGGLWGLLLHANPEVHGYISKSLQSFPDARSLQRIYVDAGFRLIHSRRHFGGMMMQTLLVKA
jgi:ubiquinone/menaquinone biosynthesis methyltransferase